MTRLILSLPPSQNHMYRNFTNKSGRKMRVIMQSGLNWIERAKQEAELWKRQNNWQPSSTQKLVMRLWFFWPNGRRRDTHNYLKLLLDTLEKILYDNDSYVLPQIIDFEIDRAKPRVEIEFERKDVTA